MKYANIFPGMTGQSKCVIQTPGKSMYSVLYYLSPAHDRSLQNNTIIKISCLKLLPSIFWFSWKYLTVPGSLKKKEWAV